jgi:hypothetical protein
MTKLNRRGFLLGATALVAAPVVAKLAPVFTVSHYTKPSVNASWVRIVHAQNDWAVDFAMQLRAWENAALAPLMEQLGVLEGVRFIEGPDVA